MNIRPRTAADKNAPSDDRRNFLGRNLPALDAMVIAQSLMQHVLMEHARRTMGDQVDNSCSSLHS